MCSLLSILHEFHKICITYGLVSDFVLLTQRRSSIIHVRGRSMWISRLGGETALGKQNGEAGRRAHTRIEFTNKTEITKTKITVKTI